MSHFPRAELLLGLWSGRQVRFGDGQESYIGSALSTACYLAESSPVDAAVRFLKVIASGFVLPACMTGLSSLSTVCRVRKVEVAGPLTLLQRALSECPCSECIICG